MIDVLANYIRKLLPKNKFARSVSVLVGGTAGSQILLVLAAPILTRLYTPEDFGLLAAFAALLALLTVVASARYELAVPLPESDQDAANIVVLGGLCVILTTGASLIVVLLWARQIADFINAPGLAGYCWLVPVGVFFIGFYQVFNKWAVRTKNFGHIARTRIWQTLSILAIQIGAFKYGAVALIGGQALGQGVGASSLAMKAITRPELKNWTWRDVKQQAYRYRDFPLYSTWTGLLNTASLQLAPLVFIALYGATVAGLYALTLRILSMPISLIGNAVGSVFLSEAPAAKRQGTLSDLVGKLHSKLAMAGSLPLAVLLFFGPDLFALIFGEQWRKAGQYSQWMAPWIYLQFQWSPLSTLASVLELQREALVSQVVTLAVRFGVLVVAYRYALIADTAVLLFAIVSAIAYLIRMFWFLNRAGLAVKNIVLADLKFAIPVIVAFSVLRYFMLG